MAIKRRGQKQSRRASALVITLALVVLLCIMVVGLTARARLESVSSSAGLSRVQSTLYAQAGADMALAKLRGVVSTNNANFWISQPGRLVTVVNGVTNAVDLSSGLGQGNANASVNLNIGAFTNLGIGVVTGGGDTMNVNWIYVMENPTNGVTSLTTNAPAGPPGAGAARAVGRFAYWVDDETAKVNLNTAVTRSTNNVSANPAQVDLSEVGLTPSDVSDYRTADHYFQTVSEAAAVTGASNAIAANAFSLTAHSMSPDLNMFGDPRIMLTTSGSIANGGSGTNNTNYINIISDTNPAADPGRIGNLDSGKVSKVLTKIAAYFTRTDWPILPGKSFANKYSALDSTYAPYQMAADIIDYVRSAESTNFVVEPLSGRLTVSGSTGTLVFGPAQFNSYARSPVVKEIGIWVTPKGSNPVPVKKGGAITGTNWDYTQTTEARIYWPPNYGFPNGFPSGSTFKLTELKASLNVSRVGHGGNGVGGDDIDDSAGPAGGVNHNINKQSITGAEMSKESIGTGTYTVYTRAKTFTITATDALWASGTWPDPQTNAEARFQVSFLIFYQNNGGTQVAGQIDQSGSGTQALLSGINQQQGQAQSYAPAFSAKTINSLYVDDPRVDNVASGSSDWQLLGSNRLSGNNTNDYPLISVSPPAYAPQDAYSGTTDIHSSEYFPAPKGMGSNSLGLVQSVGELGYVTTGAYTEVGSAGPGVPWRTIHLQPIDSQGQLPDWAILDLFSAPIPPSQLDKAGSNGAASFYDRPAMTGTFVPRAGGRINLNSQIAPFVTTGGAAGPTRPLPLEAMLNGSGVANVATAATNISQMKVTGGAQSYSGTSGTFFYSPAQVVDVQGIATAGSEESEAVIRQIADLGTTRSYVYSIYTVGQAIKQDAAGNIRVLGERRQVSTYEYSRSGTNASGLPVPLDFQCISSQDLTP